MKRGKDVLWIATPFNMHRPRRDTKGRARASRACQQYSIDGPGFALRFFEWVKANGRDLG